MTTSVVTDNDQLLRLAHAIRQTDAELRYAQKRRRRGTQFLFIGPLVLAVVYLLESNLDLMPEIIPVVVIGAALTASALAIKAAPGGHMADGDLHVYFGKRPGESALELELALLRDQKKMALADTVMDFDARRAAYKDDAHQEVESLRQESKYYRRVHNFLQAVLIVGSLATTGLASIAVFAPIARWIAIGTSFAVGIASGFIGYFKYRERGFYLQLTADAIEEESEAVDLGIGRYKRASTPEEALGDYVEEVLRLKGEQKKREQNLDQPPPEVRAGAASSD